MSEVYVNGYQTALNGAITNVATSVVVDDASGFVYTAGDFRIRFEDNGEIAYCTSYTGNTLTVVRDQETAYGSHTATSHADDCLVTQVLTSGGLDQIRIDMLNSGVAASIPAVDKTGNLYFPSDGNRIQRSNGTIYQEWGPVNFIKKPLVADFDLGWVNQDSMTIANSNAGILMCSGSGDNTTGAHMYQKTYPATPFTVTTGLILRQSYESGKFPLVGLVLANGSDAKIRLLTAGVFNAGILSIGVEHWSDADTFVADDARVAFPYYGAVVWLRITDPGSGNIVYSVSFDGINFYTLLSLGRTDYLTPTRIGLVVRTDTASTMVYGGTFISWIET